MKKNQVLKKCFTFFIGILLLGVIFRLGGISSFRKFEDINLFFAIVAFLSIFIFTFLVSMRWKIVLTLVTDEVNIRGSYLFQHYALSRIIGLFIPKELSDFSTRGLGANISEKVSFVDAFQSVFLDRLFDVFALMIFIVPSILFFLFYSTAESKFVYYFLALAILFFIIRINLVKFVEGILISISKFKNISKYKIVQKISLMKFDKIDHAHFLKLISLSLVKFGVNVFFLYFLSRMLNLTIPFEVLFWGTSIEQLAFFIAITPGGLGVFEMSWFAVLLITGLEKSDIVYFVTARRIFSEFCMGIFLFLSFLFNNLRDAYFLKICKELHKSRTF